MISLPTNDKGKRTWLYIISAAYIILLSYLITKEDYWGFLIPGVVVLAGMFLLSLDWVWFLAVITTPFAVNIQNFDMGVGVSLPSEPLMFGLLVVFLLKLLYERFYDNKILRHPLTIIIIIQLVWMTIVSLTSEIPLVSLKYMISRIWFVVPFFFMGVLIFRKQITISRFIWAYGIPLAVIVIITTIKHASFGFSEKTGHWIMTPFYNDHTAYGAILAMMIPPFTVLAFHKSQKKSLRVLSMVILMILALGLFLSYSRAAWIGTIAGVLTAIIVWLRIKFRWILLSVFSILAIFFAFQHQILDRLEKNKQDSSANFVEHVRSISNISSDASNLERINRWQAALRLFEERPIFGWGPGTYQFVYAPFQMLKEKTIISTNAGDKGNAHSEYIGPLAEQGLPGLIIVLILFSMVTYHGIRIRNKMSNSFLRALVLSITIGMITYFTHGFLNNFLDTDKLSVPFWAFIAMIVAIDVYHADPNEKSSDIIKDDSPSQECE